MLNRRHQQRIPLCWHCQLAACSQGCKASQLLNEPITLI